MLLDVCIQQQRRIAELEEVTGECVTLDPSGITLLAEASRAFGVGREGTAAGLIPRLPCTLAPSRREE